MAKKYRKAILSRSPIIDSTPKPVHRVPIKRHSIFNRMPVSSDSFICTGCSLFENTGNCANQVDYCKWNESVDKYDFKTFRLIRISKILSPEEIEEVVQKIKFVQSNGCYIRLLTSVPVDNAILFALGYDPLNTIQYTLNIIDTSDDELVALKKNIFTADNCGIYVGLMIYPIIPEVTKCYSIIELLNSLRCSCNMICFKYIELPEDWKCYDGYFNINGNIASVNNFVKFNHKWRVNNYYRRTFATAVNRFLSPRKVDCLCCNEHICY